MAYIVTAYIVTAKIVVAYVVMAYIGMAYGFMANFGRIRQRLPTVYAPTQLIFA